MQWHWLTRVGFRFFFAYFLLYNSSIFLRADGTYEQMWRAVVVWVGKHVLHLGYPVTFFTNGSGDTTSDYIRVFCYLILGATACMVWSVLDRRRKEYGKFHRWLRIYVRLVLGAFLAYYGAGKVIKVQFPPIPLSTLVERYGDSSPMALLWTMMEYSTPYTFFTGAVEMLAGILVLAPRLTMLGSLLGAAALGNVFMLNICYDVPVKLFSFHLLMMAVLLLAPDFRRLTSFFVLHRSLEAVPLRPLFSRRWMNRTLLGLQLAFAVLLPSIALLFSYQFGNALGILGPKPPLYGIWSVEEFNFDGELRPVLVTDELRWQWVTIDRGRPALVTVSLHKMNGEHQRYPLDLDLAKKRFDLNKPTDPTWKSQYRIEQQQPNWKAQFTIEQPQPEQIVLDGKMDGHQIHAKLRLQPEAKYLLQNRGFHWINEYPFNR